MAPYTLRLESCAEPNQAGQRCSGQDYAQYRIASLRSLLPLAVQPCRSRSSEDFVSRSGDPLLSTTKARPECPSLGDTTRYIHVCSRLEVVSSLTTNSNNAPTPPACALYYRNGIGWLIDATHCPPAKKDDLHRKAPHAGSASPTGMERQRSALLFAWLWYGERVP